MTVAPRANESSPARFLLRTLCWNLVLFAILRLPAVAEWVLVPLARVQLELAIALFGAGRAPVAATAECSGADAIALCLATIFAFPASRAKRLRGATLGVALLLAFNILRIASLSHTAGEPERFDLLHLWVWPALLVLGASLYIFAWMRRVEPLDPGPALPASGRFVVFSAIGLLVFLAVTPWLLVWYPLLRLAAGEATIVAGFLNLAGIPAFASDAVLVTPRGAFHVTPECVATPLLPVALAGLFAFTRRRGPRLIGLALAVPVFAVLAALRLLVLAAPSSLISAPENVAHAFYQIVAGVLLISAAAHWPGPRPRVVPVLRCAIGAIAIAGLITAIALPLGPAMTRWVAVDWFGGPPPPDPQGALALLPGFQLGLFSVLSWLWRRSRPARWAARFAGLLMSQVLMMVLAAWVGGLPVLLVRGCALAIPALLAWPGTAWRETGAPPRFKGS